MGVQIKKILDNMPSISLEEMEGVRLMNRIDTKFVIPSNELVDFLNKIKDNYYVQEVNGMKVVNYQTTYFDTSSDEMFVAHQNGKCDRRKIRVREYTDSNLTFLEVKHKNNKGKTHKVRINIRNKELSKDERAKDFIRKNSEFELAELFPRIENNFRRITLVNKCKTERLTIDCDVNFLNLETGNQNAISELVIIELKQDGLQYSPVRELMMEERIRPVSISKYCIGSVLTNPALKYNRFKKKLMQINKLINQ